MTFWLRHRSGRRKQGPRPNLSTRPSRSSGRRWRWVRPLGKFLMGIGLAGLMIWSAAIGYRWIQPQVAAWFAIKEVTVSGHSQVPRSEVLAYLKLDPHTTLLSISPKHLAKRLEAHPWIKHAEVERMPPNGLAVRIAERRAAAVLRSASMTVLLDEEGHPLSVLSQETEPALPVLVGLNPQRLMSGQADLIRVAQRGIEVAGMLTHTFDGRPEVDVTNGENIIAYVQGLRLQFGGSAFEEKWELYRKLEPHVAGNLSHQNNGRVDGRSEIDLRYPGKVIVRERG